MRKWKAKGNTSKKRKKERKWLENEEEKELSAKDKDRKIATRICRT